MSIYLSVPKNLANPCADMGLLYNVAFDMSRKVRVGVNSLALNRRMLMKHAVRKNAALKVQKKV